MCIRDRSDAVPPTAIDVADSVVEIDGAAFPTAKVSLAQALEAVALFASPEYTACQKNVPAVENVSVFEPGTTPLVTVTVPAACGFIVQWLSL